MRRFRFKTDKTARRLLPIIASAFAIIMLFSFSSCEVGYDGRPGQAYLLFDWEIDKPDYINCGTPDIPPQFYYGEFYRAFPGAYWVYYEGSYYNGYAWGEYAWEMEYEIWENPGEPGGPGYHGHDGLDSYFEIFCSPHGPYSYHSNGKSIKELPENYRLLEESDDTIIIQKDSGSHSIKITYKKTEPKYKDAPKGEPTI